MSCTQCWSFPQPRQRKRNFLIHLIDTETIRWGRCVVQSECSHGMQEWVDELTRAMGGLIVNDSAGNEFTMHHPRVVDIDAKAAEHLPIMDPDPVQ